MTNEDYGGLNVTAICLCSVCRKMLYEGDRIADLKVFKCGELDEILLAHEDCAASANRSFPHEPQWELSK